MADTTKNLKIVLTGDTSNLEVGMKAAVGLLKDYEKQANVVSDVEKKKAKVIEEQTIALAKLKLSIDKINSAERLNDTLALNAAIASLRVYNETIAKTSDELRKINSLTKAGVPQATADNRGYTALKYGTVGESRASAEAAQRAEFDFVEAALQKTNARRKALDDERNNAIIAREQQVSNRVAQIQKDRLAFSIQAEEAANKARIASMKSSFTTAFESGKYAPSKALDDNTKAVDNNIRAHKSLVTHIGEVIGVYRVYNAAINLTEQALLSIPKSLIELQTASASLTASFGSFAGASRELAFLDAEAQRTGLSIKSLRDSYQNAAASFIAAGQSAATTREIFSNINTVSTTLHLNSDKTYSIYLALSQIFNKTKLQAEELTKQLAQVIPGVTNQQAKALGITVADLYDKMKKGAISANDAVIALSRTLAENYGGEAFVAASKGLNAEIGRLSTSWTHFAETIGKSSESTMKTFIKVAADVVDSLTKIASNADTVTTAINTILSALAGLATGAVIAGIAKLATNIGGVTTALTTLVSLVKANPWLIAGTLLAGAATHFYLAQKSIDETNKSLDEAIAKAERAQSGKGISVGGSYAAPSTADNEAVKDAEAQIKAMDKRIESALVSSEKEYLQLLAQRQLLIAESAKAWAQALQEPQQALQDVATKLSAGEANKAFRTAAAAINADLKQGTQETKTALAELDQSYKNNIISIEAYFSKKQQLQVDSLNKQIAFLEQEKAVAAKYEKADKAEEIQGRIDVLAEKRNTLEAETFTAKNEALKSYNILLQETEATYLKLVGQKEIGVQAAFTATNKAKIGLLMAQYAGGDLGAGDALKQYNAIEKITILKGTMADADERIKLATEDYNAEIQKTNTLYNVGAIGQFTALSRITAKNEEYIKQLEDQLALEEKSLAVTKEKTGQVDPADERKLKTLKDKIEELKLTSNQVAAHFEKVFGDAFSASFEAYIMGTQSASKAFQSFVGSVLQGIAKIIAQEIQAAMLTNILKPIAGAAWSGLTGMFSGGALSFASSTVTPEIVSNTVGSSMVNTRFLANGDVMSGAGISAYSGTIVNKPTVFPFASGTGLMGEAGPEAILPLRRNSQGKLGVMLDANNTVQNGGNVYNITVTVQGSNTDKPAETGQKVADAIMRSIAKEEIYKAQRPGNMLNRTTKFG